MRLVERRWRAQTLATQLLHCRGSNQALSSVDEAPMLSDAAAEEIVEVAMGVTRPPSHAT